MSAMRVAVIAPGAMGAAVAWRLHRQGAEVGITLEGRGAASANRAQGLRVLPSEAALVEWAEVVLSILPPGEALGLARRVAPGCAGKLYADCNAVSPATVRRIAAALPGVDFVDVGIIGGPPKGEGAGPKFYASGAAAERLLPLRGFGLDVRVIEGGVGAASALKMSYAGITKGVTALGSAMALGAVRAGAGEALLAELADSQPELLRLLRRGVPDMLPKAYRWVAEMEEIAAFLDGMPAAEMYRGIAAHYQGIAADVAQPGPDGPAARLAAFFRKAGERA